MYIEHKRAFGCCSALVGSLLITSSDVWFLRYARVHADSNAAGAVVLASECTTARYAYSYSAVPHGAAGTTGTRSCLVVYAAERALTWYEATQHCVNRGAVLASLDPHSAANVDFIDAADLPAECAWLALVKQFFYWTIRQRKCLLALPT